MTRRMFDAPEFDGMRLPAAADQGSGLKMAGLGVAFFAIFGLLVLFQPGTSSQVLIAEEVAEPPLPVTPIVQPEKRAETPRKTYAPTVSLTPVARLGTRLLDAGNGQASQTLRRLLRQPLRVNQLDPTFRNFGPFVEGVLGEFGHRADQSSRLQEILVQALVEGQSDQYIDALLNRSAQKGEFSVPEALSTATGRFDTGRLLDAMIRRAQR